MAVSKRLRFEILRRDNHTCRYCGQSAPGVKLVIDHVLPEALGGRSEPENLVTACEPCNSGKSSIAPGSPLVGDVKSDQLRWARAMEAARAIRRVDVEMRDGYATYFEHLWSGWRTGSGQWAKPVPLDPDWRVTIDRFYEHGVEPSDLKRAIEVAMAARGVRPENTFRYFCGVVWNIIREIQDTAGQIVIRDLDEEIYGER